MSEDLSPCRLTSCPDDLHLAVARAVCSSSCFQPVTKSHINTQSSKLQGMPLPSRTATSTHHLRCPQRWISVLAHCRKLTNGLSFKCLSIILAAFCCMQFSTLYTSVCTTVISTIKDIPLPSIIKLK